MILFAAVTPVAVSKFFCQTDIKILKKITTATVVFVDSDTSMESTQRVAAHT